MDDMIDSSAMWTGDQLPVPLVWVIKQTRTKGVLYWSNIHYSLTLSMNSRFYPVLDTRLITWTIKLATTAKKDFLLKPETYKRFKNSI